MIEEGWFMRNLEESRLYYKNHDHDDGHDADHNDDDDDDDGDKGDDYDDDYGMRMWKCLCGWG